MRIKVPKFQKSQNFQKFKSNGTITVRVNALQALVQPNKTYLTTKAFKPLFTKVKGKKRVNKCRCKV